jgi:hypothetical protein
MLNAFRLEERIERHVAPQETTGLAIGDGAEVNCARGFWDDEYRGRRSAGDTADDLLQRRDHQIVDRDADDAPNRGGQARFDVHSRSRRLVGICGLYEEFRDNPSRRGSS